MLTNANEKHLIDAVLFQQLLLSNKWQIAVIFTADAPKSSRHKFCFYYFMKSSSFKLLDGKWAE